MLVASAYLETELQDREEDEKKKVVSTELLYKTIHDRISWKLFIPVLEASNG